GDIFGLPNSWNLSDISRLTSDFCYLKKMLAFTLPGDIGLQIFVGHSPLLFVEPLESPGCSKASRLRLSWQIYKVFYS
ncbi:hypothetical protein JXC34_05125, partial [Candidatus Woesearchaeota archaeon]|nr:hypothetical protein [Candidatus Woesearchaeota archaeon]